MPEDELIKCPKYSPIRGEFPVKMAYAEKNVLTKLDTLINFARKDEGNVD